MNENENNFESLRRLLVLKRYETPPPGYFDYFSSQVLQRIRAGDTGTSANWLEEYFAQAPWMGKLVQVFNVKPVFASTFAGALCLLLFLGIIYADRPDLAAQQVLQAANTTASLTTASLTTASLTAAPSLSQSADQMGIVSSTNPVLSLQPVASLFGQQSSLAQPVSFLLPGH
jgi:hypothetical protein